MDETRNLVAAALEERHKQNLKIRQPLNSMRASDKFQWKNLGADYLALAKEEINVKNVVFSQNLADKLVEFDLTITPELREEGILRDLIREIQAARKTAGLKPKDKVAASLSLPKEILEVAKKHEKDLMKETNLKPPQFFETNETKISLR